MAHFVDESTIKVASGKGGNGCVSFHREKYVPRGGPNGGNGGRGGHVILVADPQITTLLDIGRQYLYQAEHGQHGMGRDRFGKSGSDLRLRLPVGTLVRDSETGDLLADLDQADLELEIARGGRGGRGNKAFATAVHQTPREAEDGGPSEEHELHLELKLMADVGLLGFPNAGKSTFLSAVSAAHPKIADYPFTTLAPQLGISELDDVRRLVIADIPGLIEGAADGVGLGHEFLRHVERTRVLIHLLDPFDRDIDQLVADFRVIRRELLDYSATLAERPIVTAINKLDLLPPADADALLGDFADAIGEPVVGLSAATGRGVRPLLEKCWEALEAARRNSGDES